MDVATTISEGQQTEQFVADPTEARIQRIRAEIAAGTYLTEWRLNEAVAALQCELNARRLVQVECGQA